MFRVQKLTAIQQSSAHKTYPALVLFPIHLLIFLTPVPRDSCAPQLKEFRNSWSSQELTIPRTHIGTYNCVYASREVELFNQNTNLSRFCQFKSSNCGSTPANTKRRQYNFRKLSSPKQGFSPIEITQSRYLTVNEKTKF